MGLHRVPRILCVFLVALVAGRVAAQDLTPGLTYVCSGERLFIENCNMRDLSDTASCMVGHPDHILANGLMQYNNMTRGALKQLFPTCQQPSAKQSAAAHAFQQKQQATYDANVQKANSQLEAMEHAPLPGQAPQKPRSPEERETNRCITSGRLPSSCTGNALLGAFGSMLSSVLPSGGPATPTAGPVMAGVFEGASWRLDFIDGGVLVNCATLSPNQEYYTLDFRPAGAVLTINTKPRPLILAVHGDGTITGPGPVTIDGVVAAGYTPGSSTAGHNQTSSYTTTERMNANQVQPASGNTTNTYAGGGAYDVTTTHTSNNNVGGSSTPGYTNFVPRRATCPALRLSSRGASGMQTMQTDLLKSMLGGDKGPPTPAGIRMHGIYAAETGFSLEFFPESVIVGCGPDAARAYPYTVTPTGGRATIQIAAADHPISATLSPSGSLDVGSGPFQVHGRRAVGENDNGDFTFAPNEQTCSLATLVAAKSIPSGGGTAATAIASAAPPSNHGGTLSTPGSPLGNATLTIVSGLPTQPGAPSPLAGHPVVLLRTSYADSLARGGVPVPPGTSPYKYVASTCTSRTPDCQKIIDAINAASVSAARADATGTATLPGVPPGTYYLMVSARFNNQPYTWGQPVQLKAGANSITLNSQNAVPLN
jgi:hypothetical protein